MVRYIIFAITLSLTVNSNAQGLKISWDESVKLNWNNFKGDLSDNGLTIYGTQGTAVSALSLDVVFCNDDISRYKVQCYFDEDLSWTQNKKSELLLRHEQLHFDIYELFARRLRKSLDSLTLSELADSIIFNRVLDRNYKMLDNYTFSYDSATRHGVSPFYQKKWDKRIKVELDQLSHYCSKSEDFLCND